MQRWNTCKAHIHEWKRKRQAFGGIELNCKQQKEIKCTLQAQVGDSSLYFQHEILVNMASI